MRPVNYILLGYLFFLVGCATPLQQGWYDINAYYNTYYNGTQAFERGLELHRSQLPGMNPERWLPVHSPPSGGGVDEFGRAIEKGAAILRDHPRSSYVVPAVEMTGASHYYRQEYYLAMEKFEEIWRVAEDPDVRQRAVRWIGLVWLELEQWEEGARQVEGRMEELPESGTDPSERGEILAVLAGLYLMQGELEVAASHLESALEKQDNREFQSRARFLLGQVREELGNSGGAIIAYQSVARYRPAFDLEYHALRKIAGVTGEMGDLDSAWRQLTSLDRDDKYDTFRPRTRYEMALIQLQRGDIAEAVEQLEELVESVAQPPDVTTAAQAQFKLATIYRDHLEDPLTAAEWYSRAANEPADAERLPASWDAPAMAEIYGRYSEVLLEVSHLDSLLRLSRLTPEELELVVAEAVNREEEARAVEESQEWTNRNVGPLEAGSLAMEEVDEDGFLRIGNPQRVQAATEQFRAVWGSRPRVENWRRSAAITLANRPDGQVPDTMEEPGEGQIILNEEVAELAGESEEIDLSDIPFTPSARREMEMELHRQWFVLANIYFLDLGMSDRADEYYERVLSGRMVPELHPLALYGLAESALTRGDQERARQFAKQLLKLEPESVRAIRLAQRTGLDTELPDNGRDDASPGARYHDLQAEGLEPVEYARRLYDWARAEPEASHTPLLLMEAATTLLRTVPGLPERVGNAFAEGGYLEMDHQAETDVDEQGPLNDAEQGTLQEAEEILEILERDHSDHELGRRAAGIRQWILELMEVYGLDEQENRTE
ncbi:MAG: tetratricopeptide repeat protein [Balneolaceae bacterium]